MTTPRIAYRLDSSHPGSDVAGETAAALAAASLAFRSHNSSYSTLLLRHAKEVYMSFKYYSSNTSLHFGDQIIFIVHKFMQKKLSYPCADFLVC